jgi:hypothetical protein
VHGQSLGLSHKLPGASVVRNSGSSSDPVAATPVAAPARRQATTTVSKPGRGHRGAAGHHTAGSGTAGQATQTTAAAGSGSGAQSSAPSASAPSSSPAAVPALTGSNSTPSRPTSGGSGGGGSQSLPALTAPVDSDVPVPTVPDVTGGTGAKAGDLIDDTVKGVLGG